MNLELLRKYKMLPHACALPLSDVPVETVDQSYPEVR